MKYPNHLVLDLKLHRLPTNQPYWTISYLNCLKFRRPFLYLFRKKGLKFKKNFMFSLKNYKKTPLNYKSNWNIFQIFNICFIRKEKIYTKLKYSRCPQYDTVSGGLAAFLSAFIGFLICEKFGLELLDSGDFYILFMYQVFIFFSLRPFLKIVSRGGLLNNIFSLKLLYTYIYDNFILFLNVLNSIGGFYYKLFLNFIKR